MALVFQSGYALPVGDQPLSNARILHSGRALSGGSVAVSGTAAEYFAAAPLNALTYERWKSDAVPGWWSYDHGSVAAADCVCIAAHDAGSAGATLAIEYHNGVDWVALVTLVPADDAPIMAIFAPVSAQDWRISISGAACEIGVIRIGLALQMPQAIYGGHAPLIFGRQTDLRGNRSDTGQFLGRTKIRTQLAASLAWSHLSEAWILAHWPDLQRAIESEPFFLAWRPDRFSDVGYCQSDAIPVPSFMGVSDLMSVDLSVRGLSHD